MALLFSLWLLSLQVLCQSFYRLDTSECIGIYSSTQIAGQEAYIEAQIRPTTDKGSVATAIFSFQDRFLIQSMKFIPEFLICSEEDVAVGTCLKSEIGKFHVKESSSHIPILNEVLKWDTAGNWSAPTANVSISNNSFKVRYGVVETGFYCIFLGSEVRERKADYESFFTVLNPYGKLPSVFYHSLMFFWIFSILYTIVAIIWLTVSFWYWKVNHYQNSYLGSFTVAALYNSSDCFLDC
jgi:hypothetical protein